MGERVAIARALVNNPEILLADEPTGALDTETSVQVMDILKEISKDRLVIMVTHNPDLANDYFDGISFLPTLTGKGEQEKHDFLYWEFHETNMMGLRMGNWKLVVKNGACSLYDLATDVHEDTNVASKYPDIVNKMKEIIRREHTDSQLFKVTLPN